MSKTLSLYELMKELPKLQGKYDFEYKVTPKYDDCDSALYIEMLLEAEFPSNVDIDVASIIAAFSVTLLNEEQANNIIGFSKRVDNNVLVLNKVWAASKILLKYDIEVRITKGHQ